MPNPGYTLSLSSPATMIEQTDRNGLPVRKYRKTIARDGDYEKGDLKFSINRGTRDHWVKTFDLMKANGTIVRVPSTHAGAADPEHQLGEILSLTANDDGTLDAVVEIVGEDGFRAVETNDVSIYVPPTFTDGKGVVYKRPITHVAVVPDPFLPGLGKFERLAASHTGAPIMPDPITFSPAILSLARDNRKARLDKLVEGPKPSITPAVRDKLLGLFATDEVITLSLSAGAGKPDLFDQLVAILAENHPLDLAAKTGHQAVALSRSGPGSDTKNPVLDWVNATYPSNN